MLLAINSMLVNQQSVLIETSLNKNAYKTRLCAKLLLSCPTLCDPMDCSPPGSSVHRILQARILEWVAMTSSRGSSQPRDRTHVSCGSCIGRKVLYHQCHLGSPLIYLRAPYTDLHSPPPSIGFSRQEYRSGLSCPPPRDLPNPGIEPTSPVAPALQADSFDV